MHVSPPQFGHTSGPLAGRGEAEGRCLATICRIPARRRPPPGISSPAAPRPLSPTTARPRRQDPELWPRLRDGLPAGRPPRPDARRRRSAAPRAQPCRPRALRAPQAPGHAPPVARPSRAAPAPTPPRRLPSRKRACRAKAEENLGPSALIGLPRRAGRGSDWLPGVVSRRGRSHRRGGAAGLGARAAAAAARLVPPSGLAPLPTRRAAAPQEAAGRGGRERGRRRRGRRRSDAGAGDPAAAAERQHLRDPGCGVPVARGPAQRPETERGG